MGFSSVPLYLDPPNWQQQQQQLQLQTNSTARNHEINNNNNNNSSNNNNNHFIPLAPPLPQLPHPGGLGDHGSGSPPVRPNSMTERARLAKLPPPEAQLKCPRCDSTNTKFCYYNNYNLSQPRHFCKTCRRYWTFGGALRNVPVGGGCRRNKRSSSTSNKSSSSTTSASASATAKSSSSSSSSLSSAGTTGGGSSFVASLQSIAQLGGMGGFAGLSFGGSLLHNNNVNPLDQLDNYGISCVNNGVNINALLSQHHHHQMGVGFPNFLGGYEVPVGGGSSSGFQNVVVEHQVGKGVKMEDDGLNIEKGIFMGISTVEMNAAPSTAGNNDTQFWGNPNNLWTNTSTSTATTTSHLLL